MSAGGGLMRRFETMILLLGLLPGVLVGPVGIDLPMSVGAVAMSVSTMVVAANAQLLCGIRSRRESSALP